METDRNYPLNFSEIENLFITDPKEIYKLLIGASSIVLYDTNCFGFHADISNGKYYALDFFNENDVVVFVEPIIREMNYKNTNQTQPWYLDYFKALKTHVKGLIFIDERDYITFLKIAKPFLSNIEIKVKTAFLNAFKDNASVKDEINKLKVNSQNFYKDLIDITNRQENKKNRGEIALFISVQILCLLKEMANYKIFSDDSAAYIPYLSSLTEILEDYYQKANIAYVSTIRNIQILSRNLKLDFNEILIYFNNIKRNENRQIYLREIPYDTKRLVSKSDEDLAKDIADNKIEILF
jgi:hypothetical protein